MKINTKINAMIIKESGRSKFEENIKKNSINLYNIEYDSLWKNTGK